MRSTLVLQFFNYIITALHITINLIIADLMIFNSINKLSNTSHMRNFSKLHLNAERSF